MLEQLLCRGKTLVLRALNERAQRTVCQSDKNPQKKREPHAKPSTAPIFVR